MKKKIGYLFSFLMLFSLSCEDSIDLKRDPAPEGGSILYPKDLSGISLGGSCGGFHSGTYGVIASYYTYPLQTLNVSCASTGSTISVNCTALDIPNRFTILDASNNPVVSTSWLGNASYPGPWGSSLSNSGTQWLTFTKSSSAYKIRVETLTPPNAYYSPSTDYWSASVSCTCACTTCPCVACPSGYTCQDGTCVCTSCSCMTCPSGQTCVNGDCQCTTPCGGSFSGTYGTISSYYTYPVQSFDVSCAANGSTIFVSCTALDVPNRFTILDASNNFVTSTTWLGTANYPGPWGMSLSAPSTGSLNFVKNGSTYKIRVETLTPPNYSFTPQTDYWSASVNCPI